MKRLEQYMPSSSPCSFSSPIGDAASGALDTADAGLDEAGINGDVGGDCGGGGGGDGGVGGSAGGGR